MKFRRVSGWPGAYVDANGTIFRSKGVPAPLGWSGKNRQYLYVKLYKNGKLKSVGAHVIVCTAFHGPKPKPKMVAAHENGIAHDNRPENISWKTSAENSADRWRHGTVSKGETHVHSVLTQKEVKKIRERAKRGEPQGSIAKAFNISQQTVSDLHLRKRWGWL